MTAQSRTVAWILGVGVIVCGAVAYASVRYALDEKKAPVPAQAPAVKAADTVAKEVNAAAKKQQRAERRAKFAKLASESNATLAQAIQAAEAHVGGKAVEAEMELEGNGKIELEVVITKDGKFFEVEIDPATGKVLEVESDDEDDDDDDDDDDGDDDDDHH